MKSSKLEVNDSKGNDVKKKRKVFKKVTVELKPQKKKKT